MAAVGSAINARTAAAAGIARIPAGSAPCGLAVLAAAAAAAVTSGGLDGRPAVTIAAVARSGPPATGAILVIHPPGAPGGLYLAAPPRAPARRLGAALH